ncbi:MAG TPA: LysR family transcriptional regulator [Gemmatimonadaceae bacterium]|nr:LysR family transcriptional regulator [Gemmatimonadaceae bacterium]
MLDEIRSFTVLAESGSLRRASERLFLTPSALTRQIQRLEQWLGTPLLDRRVKPARITRAGRAVLDRGRHVLRIMDDLKATASPNAEPTGTFRLGIAHALAQASLVGAIQRLTNRFSKLRPVITTDLTRTLVEQVRTGALDAALTLMPASGGAPSDVDAAVVATERLVLIRARDEGRRSPGADLDAPWVVNPLGCLIRQGLEVKLREMGSAFRVAAEIHNVEMQLSLVAGGLGLGIVPARLLATHPRRRHLEQLTRTGIALSVAIVFVRAGHLGQLDMAAEFLQDALAEHFAPVSAAPKRAR